MNNRPNAIKGLAALAFLALPLAACAQVPVDEDGNEFGAYSAAAAPERDVGNEEIPLLVASELQELVGPIALYPDDLLAIILPASAYPLQIIEAGRFLEALEDDASLEPDPDWDDSIVALLNYPEVIELLNDDIDWTWRLGEAVVAQQNDVVAAIETFRDRAYAAGNLRSDEYQTVSRDEGVIEITPVSDDVIYVPYYEPERVVVYQPRPVYYYYPRAYPVYYYPYPSSYYFDRGYFWGVTTAFTIGWVSDSLHVYHHSYYGHPYYGRSYWDRWWYRRPSINVYNTTYVRNTRVTVNRYYGGDRWKPRRDRRDHIPATRPRTMSYSYQRDRRGIVERQLVRSIESRNTSTRTSPQRASQSRTRAEHTRAATTRRETARDAIRFRDRSNEPRTLQREPTAARLQSRVREPAVRERGQSQARQPAARTQRQASQPPTRPQARVREPVVRERTQPQARQPVTRTQRQVQEPTARSQPRAREPVVRERAQPQARQPATRTQRQVRQPAARSEPQARQPAARAEPQARQPARRSQPEKQARSKEREVKRESREEARGRRER